MPAWDAILNRVRYLGRRSQFDAELDDEILFHIETRAEELTERGVPLNAAREQARREFGSRALAKEDTRRAWQFTWLEDFWRDLCYAARGWAKSPGFTSIAVMSLAMGVGANCAMFVVVDAALLRPLAVYHPYDVISIHETSLQSGMQELSYPDYADLRERAQSFVGLTAFTGVSVGFANRIGLAAKTRDGQMVSGNYFDVLGISLGPGRGFLPQEDQVAGRDAVVVLSHALWKAEFRSDPGVVGRQVSIGGIPFTVIGVTPESFVAFDESLTEDYPDYFIPLAMAPRVGNEAGILTQRDTRSLAVTGRLKPGITVPEAQAELATIASSLEKNHPESNLKRGMVVQSVVKYRTSGFGGVAGIAVMLLGGGVLLVACANVAGLLISRAAGRRREIAVRLSLGAGRGRLIRQLLTESFLLAMAGGVAGIALASVPVFLLKPIMDELVTANASSQTPIRVDERAILFSIAVALVSVVLSGLWPALHATRTELNVAMNGGNTVPRRFHSRLWGRNLLVAGQVAVAMMLLTATGIIYLWVHKARTAIDDAGFETGHTIAMTFDPLVKHYKDGHARQFYSILVEKVRLATGIRSITLASSAGPATIQKESTPSRGESVFSLEADTNFFEALGIPILRGRGFRSTDAQGTDPVAVINESLAKSRWPGEDAIGKRVRVGDDKSPWVEIVGVAGIRNYEGLFLIPPPQLIILPTAQSAVHPPMILFARSGGGRTSLVAAARNAVHELDPHQAIPEVRPWGEQLRVLSRGIQFAAFVIAVMGAMGVCLALIGLYGMVSYDVRTRTREIGVRMALGAPLKSLLRLSMWQGLVLAFCGVVAGIAINRSLTQLLIGSFGPVGSNDGVTVSWSDSYFGALGLAVLILAALAAYVPARKATGVDCCEALRCE